MRISDWSSDVCSSDLAKAGAWWFVEAQSGSSSVRRRIIFTAFCALVLTGAAPTQPRRIVSLNTCADQYVLALADPAQIAALSPYGHDPELSAAVGKARAFRTLKRPAEEVLALRPDLLRSEEHPSELQPLMRTSSAAFCL